MIDSSFDQFVQQAFFGWSDDKRALMPLAHSFPGEEMRRYEKKLEPHVRLLPVPGSPVPSQALSYIDLGAETVALLRRSYVGHSSGRNNSHALIGPSSVLTLWVALGLDLSAVWKDDVVPGQPMPPLSFAHFNGRAAQAPPSARPAGIERDLVVVLSRLLDNPTEPLSIVGCPDADRLAMVWALGATADAYLREKHGVQRRWSFSTYEDRHDASIERLPEIVFLPAKPTGVAVSQRTLVLLEGEPAQGPHHALARQLVDAYSRGVPHIEMRSIGDDMSITADPVSYRAASRGSREAGDAGSERWEPQTPVAEAEPVESWPRAEPTRSHQAPAKQRAQGGKNPVAGLLNAEAVRKFDAQLAKLETNSRSPQDREELRRAFDVGAVDTVADFAEVTAGREFLLRLLKAMYGERFEDLRDHTARKHAVDIIRKGRSDQLTMLLCGVAEGEGGEGIRQAASERWADGGRSGRPQMTHRVVRALRSVRGKRYFLPVLAVAAIAVLGVVFLLGFLAGRPQPVQAGPVAPQAETQLVGVATPILLNL
jgi:hypothetical protein